MSHNVLCFVLYFWSYNNKETVRRATLEMERRFMNNNDDLLTFKELDQENNEMIMSEREMAVAYLDPRLCLRSEVMPVAEWKRAKVLFVNEYIKFYVTAKAYERKKRELAEHEGPMEMHDVQQAFFDKKKPANSTDKCFVSLDDSDNDNNSDDEFDMNIDDSEVNLMKEDKAAGAIEASKVSKEWQKFVVQAQAENLMAKLYHELKEGNKSEYNIIDDFLKLDMKPLYEEINRLNNAKEKCFGYIPLMMCSSRCQLGALNAESFCERVFAAANKVVRKESQSHDPDFVDKLVTLRMNKPWMDWLHSRKLSGMTISMENSLNDSSNNIWLKSNSSSSFEDLIGLI